MKTISYSLAKENLIQMMENVCDNHEPFVVKRKNARSVVIMSLEDCQAMKETMWLLKEPVNAERLFESIRQSEQGKCFTKNLIED